MCGYVSSSMALLDAILIFSISNDDIARFSKQHAFLNAMKFNFNVFSVLHTQPWLHQMSQYQICYGHTIMYHTIINKEHEFIILIQSCNMPWIVSRNNSVVGNARPPILISGHEYRQVWILLLLCTIDGSCGPYVLYLRSACDNGVMATFHAIYGTTCLLITCLYLCIRKTHPPGHFNACLTEMMLPNWIR